MIMDAHEVAKSEKNIAELQKRSGRICGDCSQCCKTVSVEDPQLSKPRNTWCKHCKSGNGRHKRRGGCSIYEQRPNTCRVWACMWLIDSRLGDEWFPKHAKIVVHFVGDPLQLQFDVDISYPNRWREEPYFSTIKRVALVGLKGETPYGKFHTVVVVGDDEYMILPHREIKNSGAGIHMQLGENSFEFVGAKTAEDAIRVDEVMCKLRAFVLQNPVYNPQLGAQTEEMLASESPEVRSLVEEIQRTMFRG